MTTVEYLLFIYLVLSSPCTPHFKHNVSSYKIVRLQVVRQTVNPHSWSAALYKRVPCDRDIWQNIDDCCRQEAPGISNLLCTCITLLP